MVFFCKDITGPVATDGLTRISAAPADANSHDQSFISSKLRGVQRGEYNRYAAQTLSSLAGWSYSDFETFKDMVANDVGGDIEALMIQVKNDPMLIQATAQMIRTKDKKVIIIVFRGTELTNLVNWVSNAIAKKSDFNNVKSDRFDLSKHSKYIQVHSGFKANFEKVWFGEKGILQHLLNPAMICKDYKYDKSKLMDNEQDELEAVYICGHSLGGAMAFLAGLYLAALSDEDNYDTYDAQIDNTKHSTLINDVFLKLRGVYTYGSPMVVDDRDRARCQVLCGSITFRHVYYNDLVPHLPPLSTGSFDHVGAEYRYHPLVNWKKRDEDKFGFKSGRSTQVLSILTTGVIGALDVVLDNINWLNFFRGENRDWPVIGIFSRGYLKMPWSLIDHSPISYISSLMKLVEDESETYVVPSNGIEERSQDKGLCVNSKARHCLSTFESFDVNQFDHNFIGHINFT